MGCARIQTGTAAWMIVDGMLRDRKLKKQLKGSADTLCGLGTLGCAGKEEQLEVAENNWVGRTRWVKLLTE